MDKYNNSIDDYRFDLLSTSLFKQGINLFRKSINEGAVNISFRTFF